MSLVKDMQNTILNLDVKENKEVKPVERNLMVVTFNSDLLLNFIKQSKVIKDDLGILIRAKGDEIEFIKTDVSSQISYSFTGDVEKEGSVILPKELYSLIKPKTLMQITDKAIHLRKRDIEVDLKPGDIYPVFSDDFKYPVFALSDKDLKQLLEVEHAVSKDITRPVLTGIHIKDSRFIAMDAYRISTRTGNFKTEKAVTIGNIKLLKSLKGFIKATAGERHIKYTANGYDYIDNLIDGAYIDVDKMVPDEFYCTMVVDKDVLENTLKDIYVVAKNTQNCLIKLNVKDNKCTVKTHTHTVKIKDEIECKTSGEEIDIYFNCKYLLDAIKDLENVQIKFNMPINPAVLTDGDKFELVLPVRVSEGY